MAASQAAAAQAAKPRLRPAVLSSLEWVLLLGALGLWAGSRGYSEVMNLGSGLLLASWLVRLLRSGEITRATPLDVPLVLFLATGVIGLWAAPQLVSALPRFYLFVGAAGLYYAIVNAGGQNLHWTGAGLVFAGVLLSLYFVTQHNWAAETVKFELIGQVGRWLNEVVPDLGAYKPHPNVIAGVLGVLSPAAAVHVWLGLRRLRTQPTAAVVHSALAGVGLLMILGGVVMTESRATWLALGAAVGLAAWWLLAARFSRATTRRRWTPWIFLAGVALALAVIAAVFAARPDWTTLVFGKLPGPNSATSRIEIYAQVWRLAEDTPFTGAGLNSFPALYSTFILDIPYLLLTHAHNAYLNLLVEQGWPGLLSYIGILAVTAWAALQALSQTGATAQPWAAAGAASLVVLVVQGLGDATLVASRAIAVLWVPAALVLAGSLPLAVSLLGEERPQPALRQPAGWVLAGGALALVLVAAWLWRWPLLAGWYANQGALVFNRMELAGWPRNEWNDGSNGAQLQAAEPALAHALSLAPDNRTAHELLGWRARWAGDFAEAAAQLEQAHQADPGHRGINKALGYSYLWLGRLDEAQPLLAPLPEVRSELDVYAWWWGQQQRGELANRARQMIQRLDR